MADDGRIWALGALGLIAAGAAASQAKTVRTGGRAVRLSSSGLSKPATESTTNPLDSFIVVLPNGELFSNAEAARILIMPKDWDSAEVEVYEAPSRSQADFGMMIGDLITERLFGKSLGYSRKSKERVTELLHYGGKVIVVLDDEATWSKIDGTSIVKRTNDPDTDAILDHEIVSKYDLVQIFVDWIRAS